MRKSLQISKKSVWAIVIVILMAICFIVGNLSYFDAPTTTHKPEDKVIESSRELLLFDTDLKLTQEQSTSRIKAEYLKEVGGYRSDDVVVAIIEIDGDPVIDGYLEDSNAMKQMTVGEYASSRSGKLKASAVKSRQNTVINKLKEADLIKEVGYTYSTIINAFSVKVPYGNISKIESISGVKSVILSETYNLPMTADGADGDRINTVVNDVDVYEDTGIFNSSSVSEFGITGKGTAVAVLDSGFDCSHEVFARQPEGELWITQDDVRTAVANPELNAARTTAGLKMTDVWYSNKIPFMYDYGDKDYDVFPYDSEHGTHVAGIIGGSSDTITGVAVDTQLVMMKVFSDYQSGAEEADILAAVEDSVLLGVDCINMSLGTSCGFTREADGSRINEVYDKVYTSGISLITAASNSYSASFGGDQGNTNFVRNPDSGTVGSPSTYAAALSVASISGVKSSYLYANNSDVVFFTESNSITGKRNHFIDELYEQQNLDDDEKYVFEYVTIPGYGTRDNYKDVGDAEGKITGKIALVKRGSTSFEDKALRAKNAGAIACIIYNNIEGTISMSMGKTDHIPTVSITREMGEMLASHPSGTITVSKKYTAGPFMSDFSSWGPSPNLEIKPEITAHGGEIKSSVPGGTYDNLSGTSMASPNLCGVAVLVRQFLKEQFPDYSQQEIVVLANQMLMSTATIVLDEHANPYSPRKQGAGLASLSNVVNTKAYLSVDGQDRTKLELLDDPKKTGKYNMNFNVVNISDDDVTYDLSVVGMTESVSTSDVEHVAEKGDILNGSFNARISGNGTLRGKTLTVKAGETVKVSIDYSLSSADKKLIDSQFPNGMYVEGFVKLTSDTEVDLNVPFLAFYGDWTRAPIFDKTYYDVESEAHDASIDPEDKIKADYYASTPYGSYYTNYVIPLGSYLYKVPSGYDEIPAVAEHAAVSEINGTIDGFYAVYAGLLRNCKTMTYTIVDKLTGEVVKEYVDYNVLKSFSNGGSPLPSFERLSWKSAELGLINNRQYEFKMVGRLDYGEDGGFTTNLNNTFKFDFTFDNEAPVIKSVVYEKEYDRTTKKNRYYLTMTVYDNHYVQAITPIIFNSSEKYTTLLDDPIPVYSEKGKDSKVRFEITDILNNVSYDAVLSSALGFAIDDYALNTNIYLCQLPGTSGELKFTRNGEPDGSQLTILSVYEDEIVDLTQYLSTTDKTVDADKDYLKYLDWASSNTNIAQVEMGQVRGMSAGRATVTVSDLWSGRKASLIVNVRARESSAALTEAIDEQANALGTAAAKNAGVEPKSSNNVDDVTNAKIDTLRFSYFDTIFAYARSGETSMIGETGSRIFISSIGGRLQMYPGEKINLHYEIQPWYVAEKYPATFQSSDPTTVTVDQDGNITALKKGSANITIELQGSNLMARLGITVNSEFVIDNARTLVSYKGPGGHVVIPDDEGIMYIGSYAFCLYTNNDEIEVTDKDYDANKVAGSNSTVTSVVIPDGVEEIQKYAFYNCTALKSVEIRGHVKFIRDNAFTGDESLETINLDDVYSVGRHAFEGCTSLDNINLTKTYAVGEQGFYNCTSLSFLDLTALRNTGVSAFEGCTSLAEVVLTEHTKLAKRMFAGTGLTSVDVYERVEIPEECFAGCESLTTAKLHNTLVAVGAGAFAQCPLLTDFKFMGGVQRIDDEAFAECVALESFTLADSALVLGADVFYGCENLDTINLGKDTVITNISSSLFEGTNLSAITIDGDNNVYRLSSDNSLLLTKSEGSSEFDTIVFVTHNLTNSYTLDSAYKYISTGAFGGTNITRLVITNPETVIGDYAFYSCANLITVTLPEAVGNKRVTIGNSAFEGCAALTSIVNLDSVLDIGEYAFSKTGLTEATIGEGAECGEGAFFNSALITVNIGANAKFGMGVFQSCASLKTVNMPAAGGVHFGTACFSYDTALTTIDFTKHDEEIEQEVFYGCSSLTTADLTGIKHIGDAAFADCSSLANLIMPNVITIGDGAFSTYENDGGAPTIKTLVLPQSLTSLGTDAFAGCRRLTTVTILGPITVVPDTAFFGCVLLQRVTLPSTVTAIGDYAFCNCTRLATINLGGVKTFGEGAFWKDSSLTDIDLSSAESVELGCFWEAAITGDITANKLVWAGDKAFQSAGKSSINSFTAPNLIYIGIMAFQDNSAMTEFVFSSDVRYVGYSAFYGCTGLSCFYYLDDDGEKQSDGEINDYAELVDGVLYTRLDNGDLMLASIPSGRNISTFILKERTVVIDGYAANANKSIRNVVLADSLKSIGNYAFAGCTNLQSVEFKSYTAPTLENYYVPITEYDPITDKNVVIPDNVVLEGDPGYELIHSQISMFNDTLCYYNFIGLAGKYRPIKMILPANAGVVGYDSLIYELFFGKQANAEISNYVAMDVNLTTFITGAKAIARIETLLMSDEQLVNDTISALEATNQKGTDYGYSAAEWKSMVKTVYDAKNAINAMKGVKTPSSGKSEPSDGVPGWAIAVIVVCVVVIVAAAAAVAVLIIKKRKGGTK